MKKTVAYNPSDYTIVYALAACLRAGFNLHPASNMRELWGINSSQIILLDIDEHNPAFVDLNSYQKIISNKVVSKFLLTDLYSNANHILRDNIYAHRIWKHLLDIDDVFENIASLKQGHPKDISIKRYAYALHSASVKANNTDDPLFYYKTLEAIAHEIAGVKSYAEIDLLAIYRERVSETTKTAFGRISCDHKVFSIPYREVAYAYLANVSPWLDLDELKRMTKEYYPYLSILQYRANNREYTWIGSKDNRLDIRQFFDLPEKNCEYRFIEEEEAWIISHDANGPPIPNDEFVGTGRHRYVSRFLREKIKELTTT
ncbi:MAG: hypothetical protein Q8Q67_02915 [bacterium]|nr:hypothetical protein [bacterium]